MIITKTAFKKGEDFIIVYTDMFPEIGFHVDMDGVDKKIELLAKTKIKVGEEIVKRISENQRFTKYNTLKLAHASNRHSRSSIKRFN